MHSINARCNTLGCYCTLVQELKNHPDKFFNYTRMLLEVFNTLLNKVTPLLEKTSNREAISSESFNHNIKVKMKNLLKIHFINMLK